MPTVQVLPESDELLQLVATSLFKSRKVVVITGAGISTNSGIPDFRSENGLYSLIQAQFDAVSKDGPAASGPAMPDLSSGNSSSTESDEPPKKRRKLSGERTHITRPEDSREIISLSSTAQPEDGNVEAGTEAGCLVGDQDNVLPCHGSKAEIKVEVAPAGCEGSQPSLSVGETSKTSVTTKYPSSDGISATTQTLVRRPSLSGPERGAPAANPPPRSAQVGPGTPAPDHSSSKCGCADKSQLDRRGRSRHRSALAGVGMRRGGQCGFCTPTSTPKKEAQRAVNGPECSVTIGSAHALPGCSHRMKSMAAFHQQTPCSLCQKSSSQLQTSFSPQRASSMPPHHRSPSHRVESDIFTDTCSALLNSSTMQGKTRPRARARAHSTSPDRSATERHTTSPARQSALTTEKRKLPSPERRDYGLLVSSSPLSSPPSSCILARALPLLPHRKGIGIFTPSRLTQPLLPLSSSSLSSPPSILFDPFQLPASSLSGQTSSIASSATSSETDETPASSIPSLVSQTSNSSSRSTLPNLKGRDLFDVSIWADPLRTSVFYTFATTLRQKVRDVEPTPSHRFISHLRDRGKLVRCYTQNIDQIEEKVGLSTSLHQGPGRRGRFSRKSTGGAAGGPNIPTTANTANPKATPTPAGETPGPERGDTGAPPRHDNPVGGVECVFLHGSLQSLRCFLCGRICEWDEGGRSLETLSGRQPECPHCVGATAAREEKGKRALGVGKLRPDIVLYGEEHPNAHLIDPIVKHDLALYPDLLLILGTSLKVHGLKVLVREFAKTVHCRGGKVVFVNFTKPPESSWGDIIDYWVQWDCDAWVSNLQDRVPLLWLPPGTKLPTVNKRKRESTGEKKQARKRESLADTATVENNSDVITIVETTPDEDKAKESKSDTESPQKSTDDQKPTNKPEPGPKRVPQRPGCIREDKINGAYLTWHIVRNLRKISGNSSPIQTISTPPAILAKAAPPARAPGPSTEDAGPGGRPKTKTNSRPRKSLPASSRTPGPKGGRAPTRKSLPAAILAHAEGNQGNNFTPGRFCLSEAVLGDPDGTTPGASEMWTMTAQAGDGTNPDKSILAAVKSRPRKRKRKMIDGEEISLPVVGQRPTLGKINNSKPPPIGVFKPLPAQTRALPKPIARPGTTKAKTPSTQNQENAAHVSPKILSDIGKVSMTNFRLAPIRTNLTLGTPVKSPPHKPMPLEPRSPPAGPLATISPNVAAPRQRASFSNPFAYFDSLAYQLRQPPDWGGWTTGPGSQLRRETEAALALNRMSMGRKG